MALAPHSDERDGIVSRHARARRCAADAAGLGRPQLRMAFAAVRRTPLMFAA